MGFEDEVAICSVSASFRGKSKPVLENEHLTYAMLCRNLHLSEVTSPSPLLDLAPEDLESLSLQEISKRPLGLSEIPTLAKLTGLTSLELREMG